MVLRHGLFKQLIIQQFQENEVLKAAHSNHQGSKRSGLIQQVEAHREVSLHIHGGPLYSHRSALQPAVW